MLYFAVQHIRDRTAAIPWTFVFIFTLSPRPLSNVLVGHCVGGCVGSIKHVTRYFWLWRVSFALLILLFGLALRSRFCLHVLQNSRMHVLQNSIIGSGGSPLHSFLESQPFLIRVEHGGRHVLTGNIVLITSRKTRNIVVVSSLGGATHEISR